MLSIPLRLCVLARDLRRLYNKSRLLRWCSDEHSKFDAKRDFDFHS